MSEPIVVGTDGSPQAGHAVRWAAREAARRDLPLRIVHVVGRPGHAPSLRAMPGVFESLVDSGHRILAGAEETALWERPGLPARTLLVQADSPSEGLREQAADAAEVVVGHRGLGGFTGLVLGSTGLHLAGHLPVPVVVVRAGSKEERASRERVSQEGPSQEGPSQEEPEATVHGEVVTGIDVGEDTTAVLEYAVAAAVARGARLRVVYAWRPAPAVLNEGYVIDMDEVEVTYRDHLANVVAPWRERHPELEFAEDIVCDHPVHALSDLSHKADLVVIGHHTRPGPRLGSVAHGVVHHSTCPVAVLPTT